MKCMAADSKLLVCETAGIQLQMTRSPALKETTVAGLVVPAVVQLPAW